MSNKGKDHMTDNNNSSYNSSDYNTSDKSNTKTKKNSVKFRKYRSTASFSKDDKNNPKNAKKRKLNKKPNNKNNTDNFKSESNGDSKYEVMVGLFKGLLKLVVISFVFSFLFVLFMRFGQFNSDVNIHDCKKCERHMRSYVEKCVNDTFAKRFGTAAETRYNQ